MDPKHLTAAHRPQPALHASAGGLDVVLPVYNEEAEQVRATVERVRRALENRGAVRIIVVDDGSEPPVEMPEASGKVPLTCVRHETNRGYGAALKTGILTGTAPFIAIADSDGTYPVEEIAALYDAMDRCDMAVGIRVGETNETPLLRRAPKRLLNAFASYLAGTPIRDLNSGLRVFRRELCEHFWDLLPQGFSFTSTMTMGCVLGGYRTRSIPINYYRRTGRSAIQPLRDTIRFFRTVLRLGLLFAPMRIFGPIAAVMMGTGVWKGIAIDYLRLGYVGNLAVTFMLAGLQIFLMGLLAEIIVHGRGLKQGPASRPADPPR